MNYIYIQLSAKKKLKIIFIKYTNMDLYRSDLQSPKYFKFSGDEIHRYNEQELRRVYFNRADKVEFLFCNVIFWTTIFIFVSISIYQLSMVK